VLLALCCPFRSGERFATPPTNQELAASLYLTVETVKAHLRALFKALEVEDLTHNRKRTRLVELAFRKRVVSVYELDDCAPPEG
jgi:hypothetical protein